jgi:uncharacterized protein YjiS (DUF1127 family)
MSRTFDVESVSTFAERPTFSFAALFRVIIETVRIWRRRSRARQELLDYLAMDYRAAADIGIDRSNAREWARRPFWRE